MVLKKKTLKSRQWLSLCCYYPPSEKAWFFIPFTNKRVVPSLVRIGQVGLKKPFGSGELTRKNPTYQIFQIPVAPVPNASQSFRCSLSFHWKDRDSYHQLVIKKVSSWLRSRGDTAMTLTLKHSFEKNNGHFSSIWCFELIDNNNNIMKFSH